MVRICVLSKGFSKTFLTKRAMVNAEAVAVDSDGAGSSGACCEGEHHCEERK